MMKETFTTPSVDNAEIEGVLFIDPAGPVSLFEHLFSSFRNLERSDEVLRITYPSSTSAKKGCLKDIPQGAM